jgi:heme-degrading monooxygenase HmoA
MFVVISIHHPHPDREGQLVESMHRYGQAAKRQKGLVSVHTLKDFKTGELLGLAIWESEQAYSAARPALAKATEGDDFDAWETRPIEGRKLMSV